MDGLKGSVGCLGAGRRRGAVTRPGQPEAVSPHPQPFPHSGEGRLSGMFLHLSHLPRLGEVGRRLYAGTSAFRKFSSDFRNFHFENSNPSYDHEYNNLFIIAYCFHSNMSIMKKTWLFSGCLLAFMLSTTLFAQVTDDPVFSPKNPDRSVLFGKDIVINSQPYVDQKDVDICQAFNGWLYCAFWYPDISTKDCNIIIMKSLDNGLNWNFFFNYMVPGWDYERISNLDIEVCGKNETDLKFFLGLVIRDTISQFRRAYVIRYNGITGIIEDEVLEDASDHIWDLCLASDFSFPSSGSSSSSIAILYSKELMYDIICSRVSTDGGMTFNYKEIEGTEDRYIPKVAMSYGSSATSAPGRYFITWEWLNDHENTTGNIYTAHTEPSLSGSYTTPLCIDSLDVSIYNKCRNPKIACQYGDFNNDSSNLTTVIIFETYDSITGWNKIKGFYNLQSTLSSHFKPFSLTDSNHNCRTPDIAFNPYDFTFMVTYDDSTDKKLPFLTNDCWCRIRHIICNKTSMGKCV